MNHKQNKSSFDIKSSHLSLITVEIKTDNLDLLQSELNEQFGKQPGYFENEPALIDVSSLTSLALDFEQLISTLKSFSLIPFALTNEASPELKLSAQQSGLLIIPPAVGVPNKAPTQKQQTTSYQPPVVVDKPLRSGQQVYARGADLIVTSLVSFGAEVLADGNIHVYAPLRGRAIAGAQGNTNARIFTTCFEPALYSIAGVFQTTEHKLPENILGKPAMVHLEEENLIVSPM